MAGAPQHEQEAALQFNGWERVWKFKTWRLASHCALFCCFTSDCFHGLRLGGCFFGPTCVKRMADGGFTFSRRRMVKYFEAGSPTRTDYCLTRLGRGAFAVEIMCSEHRSSF